MADNDRQALKRIGFSVFLGALAGVITYFVVSAIAKPEREAIAYHRDAAHNMVYVITAAAAGVVFMITMKIYRVWSYKQYQKSLEPPAARVAKGD